MKNKNIISKSSEEAFTLIELMIYIGILGAVLVFSSGFFWNITLGYIKENSREELQQNARFVFSKITQEIREANSVISPLVGEEVDFLELANIEEGVISFRKNEQGSLLMTKGGQSFEMTSSRVIVRDLKFTHSQGGIIKIVIDFTILNPSNMQEYNSSLSLNTSAALSGFND